jgi:hypothetical protein
MISYEDILLRDRKEISLATSLFSEFVTGSRSNGNVSFIIKPLDDKYRDNLATSNERIIERRNSQ